jgi:AraC-like DNA-binding protein
LPEWFPKDAVQLFAGLTGLRFQFLPAPPRGLDWDTRRLIHGCPGSGAAGRSRPLARCRDCARTNLQRALGSNFVGHCFLSDCGVRMFLLPVAGPSGHLGLLALRAKPPDPVIPKRKLARRPSGRRDHGRDPKFHRAMLLLRQMARTAELSSRTEHLQSELERVNRAVISHESEEQWLRRALARTVPSIRPAPAAVVSEARAHKAIRDILERIHTDYRRPLSLSGLAREFGMNTSYLSFVFGRDVGMPFRSYLATLRIQEAQKFLRDPHRRVSEVAFAVGYASVERFRAAFSQCTGLSPGRWRDTLQTPAGPPAKALPPAS